MKMGFACQEKTKNAVILTERETSVYMKISTSFIDTLFYLVEYKIYGPRI